jgi:hypothetical protein
MNNPGLPHRLRPQGPVMAANTRKKRELELFLA